MSLLVIALQCAVIGVGLSWLIALLWVHNKSTLHLVWGIFCGSLCLMMVKSVWSTELGDLRYLVGMGACATCNVFWLVSRCLFRTGQPFDGRHVLLAAGVAFPVMLGQWLRWIDAESILGETGYRITAGGLSEWIQLLSSALLLLAFWEGLRGWRSDWPTAEKRMRLSFLLTYGSCVLLCTLWTSPVQDPNSEFAYVQPALESGSALAILLVAGFAIRFRMRHQLAAPEPAAVAAVARESTREACAEDLAMADQIQSCLQSRRLFLDPELKVSDLAAALGIADYKISRAITLGLKERNFNQLVNRHRIEHAKRLLSDPSLRATSILSIGIDSGFASIGPFNRAFKALTGDTPSAFRADALAQPDACAFGQPAA